MPGATVVLSGSRTLETTTDATGSYKFPQVEQYMHLADLKSYLEADEQLRALYANPDEWARKAISNVAGSGKFSSDRTIAEYAADIWKVQPCPVPEKA